MGYLFFFGLPKQHILALLPRYLFALTAKEMTTHELHNAAMILAQAVNCGQFQDAEEMALHGLAGNTPDEIRDELNEGA